MAGTVDVGTLLVKYQADITQLIAKNEAAAASLEATGAAATGAGGMVAMGAAVAGAAIVAVGVKTVKMAADFQSGMTTLVTGAGESAANLKTVSDGILAMATDTGTSTKQLTDGMFMIESAGYHGAQGLDVLKMAAEGAKVGNADLGTVADGVTTIMKDFQNQNVSAAQATNTLIGSVANGKTHMQDLTGALSSILPTASSARIKLMDVMGAMSAMTGEGIPAADAATYLRQTIIGLEAPSSGAAKALASVGLSSTQVASDMHKSLPGTLKEITDAVGKKFPEGSAAYVDAIKKISGGSKTMQGMLALTGQHMKDFQTDVGNVAGAVKSGGSAIAGWGDVQKDVNFKLSKAKEVVETLGIKIGTALLPVVGRMADFFSNNVVPALTWFINNGNLLIPVLAGIGAIIASILVPAVWSLAAGVIAATWPFLLIGAAIAGLVAIFMHFYQTNAGFKSFIDNLVKGFQQLWAIIVANVQPAFKAIGDFIKTHVMPILQQVGAFLVSTFAPVWQQLVQVWNSQILPSLKQLWAALQPLAPVLLFIGEVIGGVVLISFGLMVGILSGVIQAIAGLLSGLATFIGGVVQMVTGFIQIISGIVQFIVDLVTGHFDKLGSDLGLIWTGIKNMFVGMWDMIKGAFQAAIGVITGLIGGFISGIVGYFTTLYNDIVGHSIIPDMINGIVSWFEQLPGRAGAAVQNMVNGAMNILNNMAGLALQAGANIVSAVANGITNGIGAVATAIGNVVATIDAHLPHSPAKVGPLRTLPQAGANIVAQLNAGMLSASPTVQAAMTHVVAYPIRPSAIGVAASSAQVASSGSTSDHTTIVELDGYQLATLVQKKTDRLVRLKLGAKGRSI